MKIKIVRYIDTLFDCYYYDSYRNDALICNGMTNWEEVTEKEYEEIIKQINEINNSIENKEYFYIIFVESTKQDLFLSYREILEKEKKRRDNLKKSKLEKKRIQNELTIEKMKNNLEKLKEEIEKRQSDELPLL